MGKYEISDQLSFVYVNLMVRMGGSLLKPSSVGKSIDLAEVFALSLHAEQVASLAHLYKVAKSCRLEPGADRDQSIAINVVRDPGASSDLKVSLNLSRQCQKWLVDTHSG